MPSSRNAVRDDARLRHHRAAGYVTFSYTASRKERILARQQSLTERARFLVQLLEIFARHRLRDRRDAEYSAASLWILRVETPPIMAS